MEKINHMGLISEQQIHAAIDLLIHSGYKVYKDYSMLVGKWVAFQQEGMTPILHGKVVEVCNDVFKVKCKNACYRYILMDNVIEFCDDKSVCYNIK